MEKKVNLVYYDYGDKSFYDVFPKITKSLARMRSKIIGVQGIKWGWHIILTYRPDLREEIVKSGGMTGAELSGFLNRTKTIVDKNRKYFWKYEEGTEGGKPHWHLYFDFKREINKEWIGKKLYKRKWDEGEIDLNKKIAKHKRYKMNYKKTDVEIMMGMLMWKKWGKGITYARKIQGKGAQYKKNIIYYVNKDLMKPSKYDCFKKGSGNHWGFGKNYKFKEVKLHSESKMVSVKYAIHKMMTTKQNFIDYYDSFGLDGYKLFFRKIRYMQQGKFFSVIK